MGLAVPVLLFGEVSGWLCQDCVFPVVLVDDISFKVHHSYGVVRVISQGDSVDYDLGQGLFLASMSLAWNGRVVIRIKLFFTFHAVLTSCNVSGALASLKAWLISFLSLLVLCPR